ncbi:insulinase family protein [Glaciimonas sp. PAMC28666]|uniref:insulinase family protein n=1 Tax=Glaciimonas sp. PAMC28666 TaxID=2807626 RepID=UPI001962EECE|nr:insulinase family protein [Glaciimonas sp. PAMC28666]QRX84544.1 insulinase family protein [Glaciimonas sp. PAMC28666]
MAFKQTRLHPVPALRAVVEEYEDSSFGARHIHLRTDDQEMVFLVAFPTIPETSDGRAHILEHLSLCGSARFPVRDPFFSMTRRSLGWMNALTYPEKTVYPFATTDRTDFFNLLDVYLDAAFFPTLDYYDFLQEGWRYAFEDGKLVVQGVVLNEMKGAFSDPIRALDQGINQHLFQNTTYMMESGGDPLEIPSLSHAALKAFHAKHYHPSQAVFMTAGNVDIAAVQAIIAERVLTKLPARSERMLPQLAAAWDAPKQTTIVIPAQEGNDNKYGFQMSWLLGESSDPVGNIRAKLLEAGLLGDASAPLSRAMESAGFGRPSALNHAETSSRQITFHTGMEGLKKSEVNKARTRIWDALEKTAVDGVPTSTLQASLRDLRFHQREIKGGGLPYGLHLLLNALPFEMNGGDIIQAFDAEPVLQQFDEEIKDPAFFKKMIRDLLDSPTRLESSILAEASYGTDRIEKETARLGQIDTGLNAEDRARIISESAELLHRQRQAVNKDVLPRIRPSDVSPVPKPSFPIAAPEHGAIVLPIASNGVSYASILFNVSDFAADEWCWLNLYAGLIPDVGVGNKNYETASAWRQDLVPDFEVNLDVQQPLAVDAALRISVEFSAKGLQEEQDQLRQALRETIADVRFDELDRLAFLIDSMVRDVQSDLAEDGSRYAALAASAPLSRSSQFEEAVFGAPGLPFYRFLQDRIADQKGVQAIAKKLKTLHQKVISSQVTVLAAAEPAGIALFGKSLAAPFTAQPRTIESTARPVTVPLANAALHASAQVNHCFAVWAGPTIAEPDAAAVSVLAELMTNEVLHRSIREEGGAYGAQASHAVGTGLFRMTSFRDPRLSATYADFEQAIAWVLSSELAEESIEEAIISVVQSMDQPRSPYAEAHNSWSRQQVGVTEAMRLQYRQNVLGCTATAIQAAAKKWLLDIAPSRAAFVGKTDQDMAGLNVTRLASLL